MLACEPLNQVTVTKYLGMFIDSNLKWDDNINKMISNISAKIVILRSLRKTVLINTLKNNCNIALVQPYFDSGDMVYASASGTNTTTLQKLQSRATRLITGSDPHTSRIYKFKELGWLSPTTQKK